MFFETKKKKNSLGFKFVFSLIFLSLILGLFSFFAPSNYAHADGTLEIDLKVTDYLRGTLRVEFEANFPVDDVPAQGLIWTVTEEGGDSEIQVNINPAPWDLKQNTNYVVEAEYTAPRAEIFKGTLDVKNANSELKPVIDIYTQLTEAGESNTNVSFTATIDGKEGGACSDRSFILNCRERFYDFEWFLLDEPGVLPTTPVGKTKDAAEAYIFNYAFSNNTVARIKVVASKEPSYEPLEYIETFDIAALRAGEEDERGGRFFRRAHPARPRW